MAYELSNDPAARQTVTAFFESAGDADKAKADLAAAGFAADDIVTRSGADHAASNHLASGQSVVKSLLDIFIFMPPHEKPTYEEAMRRGGVAVAVRTDAGSYERAIDILDRDGAIDLDERETAWKSEGWTPGDATARPGGPGSVEQAGFESANRHDPLVNAEANNDVRERIGVGTADMTVGTDPSPASAADAVPQGATRDTSHGRTRVRSYRDSALDMPPGIDPQI